MARTVREETVRRLLVAKHLLAANSGQLTPNSDAVAVARAILASHDAAELAVAAIASDLNVPGLSERTYLAEYPSKIESHAKTPFPGADFVKQLNAARVAFKHHGTLPDARQWYAVIDRTWDWLDQWCQTYLGLSIAEIDLEHLLTDPDVKQHYSDAKEHHRAGQYRHALEELGIALHRQLRHFPGMWWPVVGSKNTEHALMLAAYGVKPSDFLALQDFVPQIRSGLGSGDLSVAWQRRGTGHEGNWTDDNVRFCLETFLDLALKIQHAAPIPTALDFYSVFEDVITPKGESADLFVYEFEGPPFLQRVTGRKVVRTLSRGEKFRCHLSPSRVQEKPLSLLIGAPEIETAEVLAIMHGKDSASLTVMYVDKKDVEIGDEPRDNNLTRQVCPHLFARSDEG